MFDVVLAEGAGLVQGMTQPTGTTQMERRAFLWMQGRMIELLLRHDVPRFEATFASREGQTQAGVGPLHQHRRALLSREESQVLLHRQGSAVWQARAGIDRRSAQIPYRPGVQFRPADRRRSEVHLCAQRLLRGRADQCLGAGAVAASIDAGDQGQAARRAALRRLSDHRHERGTGPWAPFVTKTDT